MVADVRGAAGGITLLTQEMGFMLSACNYHPVDAEHIPGVANSIADVLSRRLDPAYAANWALPSALRAVPETVLDRRGARWYRAREAPAAS